MRSRAASADHPDEVVEESIEYHEDDVNQSPLPGGFQLTRHTRSHYDLHSNKKDTRSSRGLQPQMASSMRGPSRVPLQPRVSTPPCATSHHSNSALCGSGSSAFSSGGHRSNQSSCSCLSPGAAGSGSSSAAGVVSSGGPPRRARNPHNRDLRVAGGNSILSGASPTARNANANAFWQLPASPVRHALHSGSSKEHDLGTPPSPCFGDLLPGSPLPLGLGNLDGETLGLGDGLSLGGLDLPPHVGHDTYVTDMDSRYGLDGLDAESQSVAERSVIPSAGGIGHEQHGWMSAGGDEHDGCDARAVSADAHALLGGDDDEAADATGAPSAAGLHGPWYLPPDFGDPRRHHYDLPEVGGRASRAGGVSRGRMSAISATDEIEEDIDELEELGRMPASRGSIGSAGLATSVSASPFLGGGPNDFHGDGPETPEAPVPVAVTRSRSDAPHHHEASRHRAGQTQRGQQRRRSRDDSGDETLGGDEFAAGDYPWDSREGDESASPNLGGTAPPEMLRASLPMAERAPARSGKAQAAAMYAAAEHPEREAAGQAAGHAVGHAAGHAGSGGRRARGDLVDVDAEDVEAEAEGEEEAAALAEAHAMVKANHASCPV